MNKWIWLLLGLPALSHAAVHAEWDSIPSGRDWTAITLKAMDDLGGDLLSMESPRDAAEYCPRFSKLTRDQRKAFYVKLISAIAKLESDLNPKTTYKEKFKDAKGKKKKKT